MSSPQAKKSSTPEEGRFDGKVAFITGAGRGLGRAQAVALASEGADIVACDIGRDLKSVPYPLSTKADLKETKRLVEESGRACVTTLANVADSEEVEAAVATAVDAFGTIDILITNAGVAIPGSVVDMSDDAWLTTVEVNLAGVFHAIRAVRPIMVEKGAGSIVAVASTLARRGMGQMANYSASQWGILGLIKSAAAEFGPANVTVNAVCPSFVDTAMLEGMNIGAVLRPHNPNPSPEDTEQALLFQHVLPKPTVSIDDVTAAVLFLVSDSARSITGTGLDVAAGMSVPYAA